MPVKNDKEIREEIRRLRERAAGLSGFYVAEIAAAVSALEWASGKTAGPPSQDIGKPGSAHGRLSERLLKAAEQGAASVKRRPAKKLKRVK